MLKTDRSALVCDLAETYGIFDFKRMPASQLAVLAVGLRDESRIKMKMADARLKPDIMLLVGILDRLNVLLWTKTKDAEKGRNKPKSILAELMAEKSSDVRAFASGKDFKAEWDKLAVKGGS